MHRKTPAGLRRLVVVFLAGVLGLTGLSAVAWAEECGCTDTGDYKAPATEMPVAAATPPGGAYRLETRQDSSFVTLTVKRANGTTVRSFSSPIARAQWGWSPDGDRFLYRHAGPNNSVILDEIHVFDVAANATRLDTTVSAGATAAFSPDGHYFFTNAITNGNSGQIDVYDSNTGDNRWSEPYIFNAAPGNPGQNLSVAGTGFSQDDENRSFLLAYRDTNGQTQLQVRNLKTETTVVALTTGGAGAYWRFSPCGDALGVVTQMNSTQIDVSLYKTSSGRNARMNSATQMTIPQTFKFTNDLTKHKFTYDRGSGSQSNNLADNTADTVCQAAPTLSAVTFNPTTLTGANQTSSGKVTFTAGTTSAQTIQLSSSDTAALTVPASVTMSSGSSTKSFNVTSKAVTSVKTVTVTATYGRVTKTATVTVNPAATIVNPKVSNLTVPGNSVSGGAASTATVTLDVAAPAAGTTVALSSSDTALLQVAGSTVITAGQTEKTFSIQASAVTTPTNVTLTATAGGQSRAVTLTVVPAATEVESPNAVIDAPECRAETLGVSDDGSTQDPVALPFQMNYFGVQRGALYVNNNGNVTFDSAMSTYTPFRLEADTPAVIAPFLADVETDGNTRYVTWSRADQPMMYGDRPAFCVNWVDVGYYNNKSDKTNSFQLLLVDRSDVAAGDFDIIYNYDRIAWESGDVESPTDNGFGGTSAGAGYTAGTGNASQFYNIPGSMVPGSFLDSNAETGLSRTSRGTLQRGRHVFEVRNGAAPTGGIVEGAVTTGGTPLPGAPVAVCAAEGNTTCVATSVTGPSGRYRVSGVPAGSYVLRVNPPAGSTVSASVNGPFDITAGATTVRDVALTGPTAPEPGTTIVPSNTNGQGIPSVYWGDELDVDTEACAGGTATWKVTQNGSTIASGSMDEAPEGHYSGRIPALSPVSGNATVSIAVDCPGDVPDETEDFNIYIDPSGWIRDLDGDPIPGATVTLYRSDSESGPFEIVPDGSAIMSPSNRVNPMQSDAEGHFGWDVMPGYYKVRAEKAGCTARDGSAYVETEALPVPPPVFDLDLRLVCEEPATDIKVDGVTDGASYGDSTDLVIGWEAPADAVSTSAVLDGATITNGSTVALHTLPLGAHSLVVTATREGGATTTHTVSFTTHTSYSDLGALITRFRAENRITQFTATGLQDRLALAVKKANAGSEKSAMDYLSHIVDRAENQIRGDASDLAARDVLVRDAQALIAELKVLDDAEDQNP
jgi:hypothetical protein